MLATPLCGHGAAFLLAERRSVFLERRVRYTTRSISIERRTSKLNAALSLMSGVALSIRRSVATERRSTH